MWCVSSSSLSLTVRGRQRDGFVPEVRSECVCCGVCSAAAHRALLSASQTTDLTWPQRRQQCGGFLLWTVHHVHQSLCVEFCGERCKCTDIKIIPVDQCLCSMMINVMAAMICNDLWICFLTWCQCSLFWNFASVPNGPTWCTPYTCIVAQLTLTGFIFPVWSWRN